MDSQGSSVDWSDCADALTDLNLRHTHMPTEAFPGVFGEQRERAFISGEQRPNFEGIRGTKIILGTL